MGIQALCRIAFPFQPEPFIYLGLARRVARHLALNAGAVIARSHGNASVNSEAFNSVCNSLSGVYTLNSCF